MLLAYISNVLGILKVCRKCFYTNVGKVDQKVAYVAMVVHVCCKHISSIFHLFLDVSCKCVYLDVAYVSHTYCKCFMWMLRMFAMFFQVFFQVFEMHVQVLHLPSDVCCKRCI
jgi:hypothetical protein